MRHFFVFSFLQLLATMVTFFIEQKFAILVRTLNVFFSLLNILGDISSGSASVPNLNSLGGSDSYQAKHQQLFRDLRDNRVNILNL
jgi:hypothetical protein